MKKRLFYIIFFLLLITTIVFLINRDKKIYTPNKIYTALTARSENELSLGLSNTKYLKQDEVMIFIFEKPDYYGFWMKDMFYPIDIVFLDSDMKVISYIDSVEPTSYPETFYPEKPAKYVIEMNSGERKISGLDKNTKVYYK